MLKLCEWFNFLKKLRRSNMFKAKMISEPSERKLQERINNFFEEEEIESIKSIHFIYGDNEYTYCITYKIPDN